jgi:hypothetical protein
VIFSRKRGAASGRVPVTGRVAETPQVPEDVSWQREAPPPLPVPEFGPYDVEVAPDDGQVRFDLGALKIPNVPGVSLQLEAAPNGQIVRVQMEHEGSRLQIAAFAAPRSEGIWEELRAELVTSLHSSGAKVVEVEGDYGPEIAARVPSGQSVVEMRQIGIDGPRWFVHAALIGPAAVDPERAAPLRSVLQGLVVDRGSEARPVREPLPLQLPAEAAAQVAEMAAAQASANAQPAAKAAPTAPTAPPTPAPPAATQEPAASTKPAATTRPAATTARPGRGQGRGTGR